MLNQIVKAKIGKMLHSGQVLWIGSVICTIHYVHEVIDKGGRLYCIGYETIYGDEQVCG